MQVIRVFRRLQTAGEEPNLMLGLVDVQDLANGPGAFCDLVLWLAGFHIVEPEVTPAITLAHPDEFAAAVQPMSPAFAGVVDEGLAGFFDHHTDRSRLRIHSEYAVELVAALIVVEVELAAVW